MGNKLAAEAEAEKTEQEQVEEKEMLDVTPVVAKVVAETVLTATTTIARMI